MTLVIARRWKNNITLSSDSRITFSDTNRFDYGIKVFSIDVNYRHDFVFSIEGEKFVGNKQKKDINLKIGLAVTGSSITAYTIKESITDVLKNLKAMTSYSDFSMLSIAGLVFKVYEFFSRELMSSLGRNALSEFILTGYCPKIKDFVTLYFYVDRTTHLETNFGFREILKFDGIQCFGSGKVPADQLLSDNPAIKPLRLLKAVIKDKKDVKTGGALQHGSFHNGHFQVFAVMDTDYKYKEYEQGKRTFLNEQLIYLRASPLLIDPFEAPYINPGFSYVGLDHE